MITLYILWDIYYSLSFEWYHFEYLCSSKMRSSEAPHVSFSREVLLNLKIPVAKVSAI